jgi:hypothetical protein
LSREIFEEEARSRYDYLLAEFISLAVDRFRWKNLPYGLTSEQLELLLINKGQLMYFKDSNLGELLLPCYPMSDINVYGIATTYNIMGENSQYNNTVSYDDGVILKNNPLATPDLPTLEIFAKRIDDVEMTQDVNLFQQCTPKLILADEDSKLTSKRIVQMIREFRFVIFGKKSLVNNVTTSDVLDTSSPYILDKLQQHKMDLKNELLTYLGINNNNNTYKKERMISDEVNANNDYIETMLDLMYEMRVKFCEDVKEKFGKDIQVEKREVEEDARNDISIGGND